MSLLTADEIAYRYPQHDRGVGPLSFKVNAGDLVLVSGPSGCGKSTFARCLTGFIPHLYRGRFSGIMRINGTPTTAQPLWQISEQVGFLFQNPDSQMLTGSAAEEIIFGLENLGLERRLMAQRLETAVTQFALEPLRHRTPQTLSGGEQQRLALAAVMARRPQALVLDEPFSMLDTTAATELVAHLQQLRERGITIVLAEHRQEYVRHLPGLRHIRLNGGEKGIDAYDNGWLPPVTAANQLRLSGLTVRRGGSTILDNIDLTLSAGEIIAIVGRNGAGKTTLLRALAGLQKYSGEMMIDGRAPHLGLVFQNPDLQLFNASVRAEILYGLDAPDMERYRWLLEMLGLGPYETTPPLLLSEGEKKRLALATVLMRQPEDGVLLDEPSLGQDSAHKALLLRLLRRLAGAGQLVLITTHDMTLAAAADRLILLGADGIVADGPPAEIFAAAASWQTIGLMVPDWLEVPKNAAG